MRTALLFIFFFLSFLSFPLAQAQESSFQYRWSIGTPMSIPKDVAVDKAGNILILQSDHITKTSVDGQFLERIDIKKHRERMSGFSMVLDTEDNIYVADSYYRNIIKYSPSGEPIFVVGMADNGSTTNTYVGRLAIDEEDNLYVTDNSKKQINKFDPQGRFIGAIGSGKNVGGKLDRIMNVGVDGQGNVYVLDAGYGYGAYQLVHKYSPTGDYVKEFNVKQQGPSYNPNDIVSMAVRKDGSFYTVHDFYRQILHYNPNGALVNKFAGHGGGVDGNLYGTGLTLAVDRAGNVYACDDHTNYSTVNKYTPDGKYVRKYGREYQFYAPIYDRWNNIYAISGNISENNTEIHKYNPAAELVLKFKPDLETGFFDSPQSKIIAVDQEENIYYLQQNSDKQQINKYNKSGQLISTLKLTLRHENTTTGSVKGMFVDNKGIIHVVKTTTDRGGIYVTRINQQGEVIGQPVQLGKGKIKFSMLEHAVFDDMGFIYTQDFGANRIRKFSPYGDLLIAYGDTSLNTPPNFSNFSVDNNGNAYLSQYTNYYSRIKLYKYNGELSEHFPIVNAGIGVNKSGTEFATLLFNGTIGLYTRQQSFSQSYITGKIFTNTGNTCEPEVSKGLAGMVVMAEPGPYFGISDEAGFYTLAVEPGDYSISQKIGNQSGINIEENCSSTTTVSAKQPGKFTKGPDFGNRVTLSPHLSVSVSSTRRRRCFESTTTVHYENSGFAPAPDAKVYVQLPAEVEMLSADKVYTRLPDGTYEFEVGDLLAGQRGTITIKDIVTCGDESVRGRTVCTRAWITPTNNAPAQPIPTITITGRCDPESGMIRFVIRNSGTADMEQHELFRKFRDGRLASKEQIRLAAGDSLVLLVPSMGYTWRLEADQPEGNGDNKIASVTIEGCSETNAGTTMSSGLVNLMPTDDEEAEVSEECVMITDSYDPNDKLVTPAGRTDEHYTPTGTALKYKIRFQNTGTDVAYRVVVVDTLSEHLDLSTLQLGAASHAHRLEVSGKGRPVLTWTFDNIMLPDSTANEPGSHGYIQFSIKPKANLPEKTAVENFADIFFDFNSPVRTNVTLNRIYDMPPVVDEAVRVNLEDVLATPAIAAFAPAAGKYGTEVTISGKRFAPGAADNKVYLNGKAATVVSATASELRVLVPEGATTGALKVVTLDGGVTATETFEVYQPPVLHGFSPAEGVVGSIVNLQGQHLQPELIEAVTLGNLDCGIISHSGDIVSVKVPAGATTGTFWISTKGGEAVSSSPYVVWYRPAISSLSKESGIVGSTLTITGENFATDKTRNSVLFGLGQAQVLEANPQQLVVRVPEQAESGLLTVETPGGQATTRFEVIPGPRFTAMQPARGSVGTVVEISGRHFGVMGLQDRITFNGQEALVLDASGDRYKVRVPRGATTGKVAITGYGGKAYSTADFLVEQLTPEDAVQVYPNPTSGRLTLNLQHADFDVRSVEIYDGIGRLIHSTTVNNPRPEKLELQIKPSKPGIYTLHIKSERGMIIKKITVL